jgi:ribosome-associated toxin RatA of RatAB toxin-antitoxin module
MKDKARLGNADRQRLLRQALMANGTFSGISGLLMTFYSDWVASLIGTAGTLIIQLLGIGLILFSLELYYQSSRKRMIAWRALVASLADFGWVALSVLLLLWAHAEFSVLGVLLILFVAVLVALFGMYQLYGISQLYQSGEAGKSRLCVRIKTPLERGRLWESVGDLGAIAEFAPFLKTSKLENYDEPGSLVGARRTCSDLNGRTWSEVCTDFRPEEGFAVRFESNAPDFPFPMKEMTGGWKLEDLKGGCEVEVWWEFELRSRILGAILLPLISFKMERDMLATIQAMVGRASKEAVTTWNSRTAIRLIPRLC